MDQGGYESLSSNRIAIVDQKYRFLSVNNEGDNSSSCDIEHTELNRNAAVRDNSPARSTHHCRAQHSCFHTHCGVDTCDIKLASNGRILVRIVFQSQAVIGHRLQPNCSYSSLCNLCVLCLSVVLNRNTTETQRTQRLHRENRISAAVSKHSSDSA